MNIIWIIICLIVGYIVGRNSRKWFKPRPKIKEPSQVENMPIDRPISNQDT